ncbi:MAG: glycosyltransferase [Coprococcus sp.]
MSKTQVLRKLYFFAHAYKNIKKAIRTDKPDVVHIHMSYKGSFYRKYLIHKLCKKYDVPDVIHLHGSEFQKWYNESNSRTKKENQKSSGRKFCIYCIRR